eukprot:CAMPEP_0178504300 /NCGR_PEP_ID=MMETSP0696-20121128/18515_1 /TAXON_ID=265572 /ORGANISM="Extubocellulus spinifer, Strain CCMP396" /LENGTH=834 /DNA_ID=CAMNT_0020133517 /DNA_START=53 /DNA_END=2557 /DNA_ORIENTATION=+
MSNRKVPPVATKRHPKGSIITTDHEPLLLLPPLEALAVGRRKRGSCTRSSPSSKLVDFCPGCGRSITAPSQSASMCLPRFPFPTQDVPSADGQDETHIRVCSPCRDNHQAISCLVPPLPSNDIENSDRDYDDEQQAKAQLLKYLQSLTLSRGQDDIQVSAVTAACSLVLSMNSDGCNVETMKQALNDMVLRRDATNSNREQDADNDDDMAVEVWTLLRPACSCGDCNELLRRGPMHFSSLVQSIRRSYLYSVNAMHPLRAYAGSVLPALTENEMDTALHMLQPFVDWAFRNDGKCSGAKAVANTWVELGDEETDERILRYRRVARLAQTLGSPEGEEGAEEHENGGTVNDRFCELSRSYQVVSAAFVGLPHSCDPNCAVVGVSSKSSSENDEPVMNSMKPVRLGLLALRDIEDEDDLTISRMDGGGGLDLSIEERAGVLNDIFGPDYICNCDRCDYERLGEIQHVETVDNGKLRLKNKEGKSAIFLWRSVKALGDLSMQQERYSDASELYSLILRVRPAEGDVLHARAASFLERGSYYKSQVVWKEACIICPQHEGIALAALKQEKYRCGYPVSLEDRLLAKPETNLFPNEYITIMEKTCFMTMPGAPLLSPDECKRAIRWAEDAATVRADGWTTSRHYAVPTTDIPVHEIPACIKWFNDVLDNRLRPLMANQFGSAEVGVNGSGVRVHDAFVVRYDADGGQRHLPIHTDDSTHSITIALNDVTAYDGGGTYVVSLGRAFRPSLGGVMTFRGDQLQHGADPVVRGTRYVIVAFCYVSEMSLEACAGGGSDNVTGNTAAASPHTSKRPRIGDMFNEGTRRENEPDQSEFSFGFQM